MTAWLEGDIRSHSLPIHYYRTGGAKPSLVLLHGLSDNGLCWTPITEELVNEYDVLMLDARSHGLSGPATEGFSLELLAADVAACLEALQLKNVHLLGHSMGAATAAMVAARYPHLVQSLILEDPAWHHDKIPVDTPVPPPEKNFWLHWLIPTRELSLAERIAQARKDNPSWPEGEFEPWAISKEQLDLDIFYRYNIGVALFSPHWSELVPQISCPTLLLAADEKRGAAVSAATTQEVAQLSNKVQVVHFADTGHSIHRERHADFMTTIRAFLNTNAHQE